LGSARLQRYGGDRRGPLTWINGVEALPVVNYTENTRGRAGNVRRVAARAAPAKQAWRALHR